jgi:hypothetical protein
MPEPKVLVEVSPTAFRSDCGNGCGNRVWCRTCRADIRSEALRWLRELNVADTGHPDSVSWGEAWSQDLLLAVR